MRTESTSTHTYWAFISYSHRDEAFCGWLHNGLDSYKTPQPLIGQTAKDGSHTIPEKLYPIFRDREELPAGANLSDAITSALQKSRYLVVICSPHSAQSHWVNEEVRYFESLGREKYILPIILDGEPNANPLDGQQECFPAALRSPKEPLAADAREDKDGKDAALMKLRAGLLGVGLEDLVNRELQRQKKQARRNGFIAVSMVLLAVLALASCWFAWEKQQEADTLRKEAVAKTKDAEHNYGLALAEKANWAFTTQRAHEGYIYAAHALARIDKERGGDAETIHLEVMGSRLRQPKTEDAGKGNNNTKVDGSVAFSPDGKMLASISSDNVIWLWDAASSEPLATLLNGHENEVVGVAFSSDGKTLISQEVNSKQLQWRLADLSVTDWAAQAAQDEKRYGLKLKDFKLVPIGAGIWVD